jgi:GNAT superfamily N-acetyltransferase
MYVRYLYIFISCLLLVSNFSYTQQESVKSYSSTSWLGVTHTKMLYKVDDCIVGCLHCTNLFNCLYVLHTFYIKPEHRGKGYGSKLLLHGCDVVKKIGAKRVFVQPGPFEIDVKTVNNYSARLQKLVAFYKGRGFIIVPKLMSNLATLVYKVARIDEDAAYLMVKRFN